MLFLVLMAALGGDPAAAQPHFVTNPDWLSKPSGEDLAELYPKSAAARRIEGAATIRCTISAAGDLIGCKAIQEMPAGEGFGDAAVAMSAKFKMRPMTLDGAPVAGSIVKIPIRFVLPKDTFTVETALRCYGYSSAAAEKDPSSDHAQAGTFMWRMLAEAMSQTERLRPSEMEARLVAARQLAGRGGDSAGAALFSREDCEKFVTTMEPQLKGLMGSLPR